MFGFSFKLKFELITMLKFKIVIGLLLVSQALAAQPVRVMTYNIRFDNPSDGVNRWNNRKQNVFSLIRKYNPDVFGVQEALHHQLEDIKAALGEYEYVGAGRDDGKTKGEYAAIFYRRERFAIVNSQTFWLSMTPGVAGSKHWDAAITRVATWARMTDKKTNRDFLLVNTHFDHIGKEARKNSAKLLKDTLQSLAGILPVILTGDFNCTRQDPPYEVLTSKQSIELYDPAPDNPEGTFCNFGVSSQPCTAIDYIFHTADWKSSGYEVIKDNDGNYYPSDHLPVIVQLALK
jgi:endonuclease/exonuclease/phosphatase family metal-dependent hydrolase